MGDILEAPAKGESSLVLGSGVESSFLRTKESFTIVLKSPFSITSSDILTNYSKEVLDPEEPEADFPITFYKKEDLREISLVDSVLPDISFVESDLTRADLSGADLRGGSLQASTLKSAVLKNALLSRTNLVGTSFEDADLTGTCLDPGNPIHLLTDADLKGFELDHEYVIGYRAKRTIYCPTPYTYEVGQEYVAPYFSTDLETCCHPGIYLGNLAWFEQNYPNEPLVKVRCLRSEMIKTNSGMFRCKRLFVLEDVV